MSTGHSLPRVARAIAQQSTRLMQIGNRFTNVPRIELGEKLAELAPPPLKRALFCSTGSEANETALRIAKKVTGRFEVIALSRGYHGRTLGAFSLSGASRRVRRGYGPMVPGAMAVPAPYELRCPFQCGKCDLRCWSQSVELIDRATTGEPAAVILEFVIGAGGVIPLPPEWVREVRRFCDERGALMVADEALTGLGRTGTWFAFEQSGVVPDVVVISKALGGGVPTAAILTSPELAAAALDAGFMQTASHQGDPLQCAVALANIDVMERENLLDNARQMGQVLATGLRRLVASYPIAGDARGIGLIRGLEITTELGEEAPNIAAEVSVACMDRGLILGGLRPGIPETNTLRLAPPLVVTEAEIAEALGILEEAVEQVSVRRAEQGVAGN